MKKCLMFAAGILGALVISSGVADASSTSVPVPDGSYLGTCKNYAAFKGDYPEDNVLVAYCPKRSGGWKTSFLYWWQYCGADIANCNGNLTCGGCY